MASTTSYGTELPNNHAVSPNTSGSHSCWSDTPDHSCLNIWRDFYFYSTAVIIPLGLIFNSVSLGVFSISWMRRTIPGRYFMALAVADNLVLLCEYTMWLNTLDIDRGRRLGIGFFHTVNAWCKLICSLRYGSRVWSSWVTVSITIERFLTIARPFNVNRPSSPNKVIVVVLFEALVCYGIGLVAVFMVESGFHGGYKTCLITQRMYRLYNYVLLPLMAGIGEVVLPMIITLFFTCLIIAKLYQAHQERMRMSNLEAQSQRKQLQPTVALVCIASTFIIIRLPYLIMFYINQYSHIFYPDLGPGGRLRIYALYKVAQVLAITNYAVNFFIFCMAGNTFREEMFRCFGHQRKAPLVRGFKHGSISSSNFTSNFRDRITMTVASHIEMKMTSYGAASLRGTHIQEEVADSNSDSASHRSFLPAHNNMLPNVNGVNTDDTW